VTQQLDEPWGRFDLDFPNDERFLAMPERDEIRSKAYLLLLAMGGRGGGPSNLDRACVDETIQVAANPGRDFVGDRRWSPWRFKTMGFA
jgi:hypothetical protein